MIEQKAINESQRRQILLTAERLQADLERMRQLPQYRHEEVLKEIEARSKALESLIQAQAMPAPRGEIVFDNVDFAYPGRKDAAALSGFCLKVKPGERIALVGPSGAGKSTVFRLLLRFYDPDQGKVLIDGADLTSADPREVRTRISLVAQDASLFSTSASEISRAGRASQYPPSGPRCALTTPPRRN